MAAVEGAVEAVEEKDVDVGETPELEIEKSVLASEGGLVDEVDPDREVTGVGGEGLDDVEEEQDSMSRRRRLCSISCCCASCSRKVTLTACWLQISYGDDASLDTAQSKR